MALTSSAEPNAPASLRGSRVAFRRRARAVLALASITVRESVRIPAVWIAVLAGLALMALLPDVTAFALGAERAMMLDTALATLGLVGALVALFCTTNVVRHEIESRTILTLLAKPVGRADIVIGKFAGIATVLVGVGVLGALVIYLNDGRMVTRPLQDTPLRAAWDAGVWGYVWALDGPRLLGAVALVTLQSMMLSAVLLAGSVVLATAANALLGFGFFALGHLQETALALLAREGSFFGETIALVYRGFVPNFRLFAGGESALTMSLALLGPASAWAACYIAAVLAVAVALLSRDV